MTASGSGGFVRSASLHDDERSVVGDRKAGSERGEFSQDRLDHVFGGQGVIRACDVDAVGSEYVALAVHRLDHTIGEEDHLVAGLELHHLFRVDLVGLDAERQSLDTVEGEQAASGRTSLGVMTGAGVGKCPILRGQRPRRKLS